MTFDIQKRHHYWFQQISQIPRASYNEKGISDFICAFAKEHNFKYKQDEVWNVCVWKQASKGYENASALILQAHMDMVPAVRPGSKHDFTKDPIELIEKDGWLYAKDTTLGADDGIGVAWMLAILEDDSIQHPPLECIFTVQEEVGLGGAMHLQKEDIQADRLISLDSMNHDVADLCCAGGCYGQAQAKLHMLENHAPTYVVHIAGLQGGHSGTDIHKERGNANIVIIRMMEEALHQGIDIHIVNMHCSSRSNAIPPEAEMTFASDSDAKRIVTVLQKSFAEIQNELSSSDPNITYTCQQCPQAPRAANTQTSEDFIHFLSICPNGFQHVSMSIPGLTVTSLNLGTIETKDDTITMQWLIRSMFASAVQDISRKIAICAKAYHIEYQAHTFFPGWEYAKVSPIRDKFAKALEKHGNTLKTEAAHGGLEVGVFASLHPGLDITTVGAVCENYHTFDERLQISSFDYGFEILKDIIAQCCED